MAEVKSEEELTQEILSDPQAVPKLLLGILKAVSLLTERLTHPAQDPVFSPQRITLAASVTQSFERSSPFTTWVIAVENSPSTALVNVHWGEIKGMQPIFQLAAGDVLIGFPALTPHLLLENPSAGNSSFTLIEVN